MRWPLQAWFLPDKPFQALRKHGPNALKCKSCLVDDTTAILLNIGLVNMCHPVASICNSALGLVCAVTDRVQYTDPMLPELQSTPATRCVISDTNRPHIQMDSYLRIRVPLPAGSAIKLQDLLQN
jgi:hypothetical protein